MHLKDDVSVMNRAAKKVCQTLAAACLGLAAFTGPAVGQASAPANPPGAPPLQVAPAGLSETAAAVVN
ncbi:MAG: hypothetical protein ACOYKF_08585, partial [Phenylobacterium sp.]